MFVGAGLLTTSHWKDALPPNIAVMGDNIEEKAGMPERMKEDKQVEDMGIHDIIVSVDVQ